MFFIEESSSQGSNFNDRIQREYLCVNCHPSILFHFIFIFITSEVLRQKKIIFTKIENQYAIIIILFMT